jgi:hypothetical protein
VCYEIRAIRYFMTQHSLIIGGRKHHYGLSPTACDTLRLPMQSRFDQLAELIFGIL